MNKETCLIIDGNYMLHRIMHSSFSIGMATTNGVFTGGCYGVLRILRSAINQFKPSRCIYVWDRGTSKRRRILYEKYKVREDKDDEDKQEQFNIFMEQVHMLDEFFKTMGIHSTGAWGKEGDDVCYLLTQKLKGKKILLSDDRDYILMINENVDVCRSMAKEYITLDNCKRITGYTPGEYLLLKIVTGDSSDKIKGVYGAGEKTVQSLLDKIGGFNFKQANADNLNEMMRRAISIRSRLTNKEKKIINNTHIVKRNLWLMDCSFEEWSNDNIKEVLDPLNNILKFNENEFLLLVRKYQFNTILKGYSAWSLPFSKLN